jgi:hypothetical protein
VIRLVRPSRLSGRVVADLDAAPVPGIGVVARTLEGGESLGTTSAADGTYAFDDLPAGEVSVFAAGGGWVSKGVLEAKESGYSPLVVEVPVEGKATFDLRVVRGGRAEGRVLDAAGAPAAGALVTPAFSGNQRLLGWMLVPMLGGAAAPDGAYAVDGLPPGAVFTLSATASDAIPARAGPFRSDPAAPVRADLQLAQGTRVDVLVVEKGTQTPVAGARVTAGYWMESGAHGNPPEVATGPDGRAKIGPVSGTNGTVSALLGDRTGVTPLANAVDGAVTIELSAPTLALEISGRVEFADGGSFEGLEVWVQLHAGERSDLKPVDADGTFRFLNVPAGTVKLTAQLGWGQDVPTARAETTAGTDDVRLRFAIPRPAAIEVRVVDGGGAPVPAFLLSASGADGVSQTQGRDGRYTLFGVRDDVWVVVWKAKTVAGEPLPLGATAGGPFPAGRSPVEVRLVPERIVEGVVRSKDGSGLRGVVLTARPLWLPTALASNTPHGQARTDERGAFRIGGLGVGEYALAVSPPPEYPTPPPVSVAAGETHVDVTLGRGAAVEVTVLSSDGRPVLGAAVTARSLGQRQRLAPSASTDGAGIARIEGLDPAARYELGVAPPQGGKVGLAKTVADWSPRSETVRLDSAFSIRGTFRRADGKPIVGVYVTARPVPGSRDELSYAQTKADGGFSFDALKQGTYRIVASTSAPRYEAPDTLLEAGGPDVALVAIECLGKVSITFEGWPKEQEKRGFQLQREGAAPGLELSGTATDGRAVVEGLRPDATYTLYGSFPNGLVAYAKGIRAGEAVVPIRPGKSIQGRLKLPAIRSFVNVYTDDVWATGKVEADGTYVIPGVPDGTWTVHVQMMVDQGWWTAEGKAEAGGTLDLEPKPK